MIHTIEVTKELSHEELKKELRKKLMTGGAVIRIAPGATDEELMIILDRYLPVAEPYSAAAQVLRAIAQRDSLPVEIEKKLLNSGLAEVLKDLESRGSETGKVVSNA